MRFLTLVALLGFSCLLDGMSLETLAALVVLLGVASLVYLFWRWK